VIKCADMKLFGVVKISAEREEDLYSTKQKSRLKHSAIIARIFLTLHVK